MHYHETATSKLRLRGLTLAIASFGTHQMCRVFREHHRCTIGDYIRRLRIESASRQILTSKAPLVEIAAAVGFSDQSHFSRIFKRVMGVTPTEYRAAHPES